jgi:hypothetical protein
MRQTGTSAAAGRNDRCPCGSGKKYKKCCLEKQEERLRQERAAAQAAARAVDRTFSVPSPAASGASPGLRAGGGNTLPEQDGRDAMMDVFESLDRPQDSDVDVLLTRLLPLPAGVVDWAEVMEMIFAHPHLDVVNPFHRIAAGVHPLPQSQLYHFFDSAAHVLTARGHADLLPEVAAGFSRLDQASYDAEALVWVEEYLLEAHHDEEALRLLEQFLPCVRTDQEAGEVHTATLIQQCDRIFHLRIGRLLRIGVEPGSAPAEVAEHLWRDIKDELPYAQFTEHLAGLLCEPPQGREWSVKDFVLPRDIPGDDDMTRGQAMHLHGTLLEVARESWQHSHTPPGSGLVGLLELLLSIYAARGGRAGRSQKAHGGNLLDHLDVPGLEERIDRHCDEFVFNFPKALLMTQAHGMLLQFAGRHALAGGDKTAAATAELEVLRAQLRRRWREEN